MTEFAILHNLKNIHNPLQCSFPMTQMCNIPCTSIFLKVHLVALHNPDMCVGLNWVDGDSIVLLMPLGSLANVMAFWESPLYRVQEVGRHDHIVPHETNNEELVSVDSVERQRQKTHIYFKPSTCPMQAPPAWWDNNENQQPTVLTPLCMWLKSSMPMYSEHYERHKEICYKFVGTLTAHSHVEFSPSILECFPSYSSHHLNHASTYLPPVVHIWVVCVSTDSCNND